MAFLLLTSNVRVLLYKHIKLTSFLKNSIFSAHSTSAILPNVPYTQGQYPDQRRKIREYFYFVDHHGFLFLDDSRMKNFTSCFKEVSFLEFFFQRLRRNKTGRYQDTFPFVSMCGLERNFVRCDDLPIVFTRLFSSKNQQVEALEMNHSKEKLFVPFRPQSLLMDQHNGRVYHQADLNYGGVGLVKSSLAIELSRHFVFQNSKEDQQQPTHFTWNNRQYELERESETNLDSLRKQIGNPVSFFD